MKVGEHTEVEVGEHLSHTHEVELTGIGGSAFLRSLSDDLLEVHEVAVSSVPLVVVGGGRSKLDGVAHRESLEVSAHVAVTLRRLRVEVRQLSPYEDVAGKAIYRNVEFANLGQVVGDGNVAELEEAGVVDTCLGHRSTCAEVRGSGDRHTVDNVERSVVSVERTSTTNHDLCRCTRSTR